MRGGDEKSQKVARQEERKKEHEGNKKMTDAKQ